MTAWELFEAIGQVDDDLILEADAPAAPRRAYPFCAYTGSDPAPARRAMPRAVHVVLTRVLPAAACLCLVLLGAAVAAPHLLRAGSMNGAAGDTQDAATAPETAGGLEDYGSYDAGAPAPAPDGAAGDTAEAALGNTEDPVSSAPQRVTEDSMSKLDGALPVTVRAALVPTTGDGSANLLAYSADELYFTDLAGADVPATLPVYRSVMADHTLHEDAMRAALRQALDGLALDGALAADAVFETSDSSAALDAGWAELRAADDARGENSLDVEVLYWGGAASLTLQNTALADAGVDCIWVNNDLTVGITYTQATGAPLDPLADAADAAQQARTVQARAGRLLRTLGTDTAAIEGGDRDITGEPCRLFTTFYAAGQTETEELLNIAYGTVTVSNNTDGTLSNVFWNAAGRGTLLGEYAVLGRDEALALLAQGACYGGDDRVPPAQAAGQVLASRLVYTAPGAALHVPVWEFMVEAGPSLNPDAAAMGLKEYTFYYVPAIAADDLLPLAEAG